VEAGEELVPARAERGERLVDGARVAVAVEERMALLRRRGILEIREDEREPLLGAGLEPQPQLVRADWVPAVGDAAGGGAGEGDGRLVQPVVHADERVAGGVEAVDLPRAA